MNARRVIIIGTAPANVGMIKLVNIAAGVGQLTRERG